MTPTNEPYYDAMMADKARAKKENTVSSLDRAYRSNDTMFDAWMADVNRAVMATAGVSVYDLPDWNFRSAYGCGSEPNEVAEEVLEDAGWNC